MAEAIEVIIVRMEGTIDRVSGKIDHIEDWTQRQDQRLNHHSARLTTLETFKNLAKGGLKVLGIVAAVVGTLVGIWVAL